jgi:hypothetical protein
MRDALLDVAAVYPGARIDIVRGGIRLHPTAPAVAFRPGQGTSSG